jgi:hypothetical protein
LAAPSPEVLWGSSLVETILAETGLRVALVEGSHCASEVSEPGQMKKEVLDVWKQQEGSSTLVRRKFEVLEVDRVCAVLVPLVILVR